MKKEGAEVLTLKVGLLVEKEGSLLLIKELSTKKGRYFLNIIKGTYELSDNSLIEAAKREALEEAGISVEITGLLNIFHLKKDSNSKVMQVNFIATTKDNPRASQIKNLITDEHIIEANFFTREELQNLKEDDFINQRAYLSVQKYLSGQNYDLSILDEMVR
jgi:ADP-ribose pyrophosphatase YjhB (NUDIX family)